MAADAQRMHGDRCLLGMAWFLDTALKNAGAVFDDAPAAWVSHVATAFRSRPGEPQVPGSQALVSALDQELLGAVLRFLRAVGTDADRRVLAPLYLQEMVYRVLQREQFARLLAIAAAQAATNPVSAVLDYVRRWATPASRTSSASSAAGSASLPGPTAI